MFSFSRVRISVTVPVRQTDKKSLSDCAELVDETPRFTTEYTDEYNPIVPDNSNPAASGKMASFSATSC